MTGAQNQADLPERLDAAASACSFLSHLLLRPEAGPAAQASLSGELIDSWPLERDAATRAGLDSLRIAMGAPAGEDDLRADYTALFIGPGPMLACPYESVQRGEERLTFDVQTHEVRAAYGEFGLQAPALHREPDDHVGLELAFVGALAAAALEAYDAGDTESLGKLTEGAHRFVTDHLTPWVPELAEQISGGARTALYRGMGHLLRGAVWQLEHLLAD